MPRAIWSGSLSFGLLNVPVKLYSAVSRQTVRFRELRASDGSRVRHKRVAEADEQEVGYDEIVKGYEISPERYVTISKDELAQVEPEKSRTVDIVDFVDLESIDPIYFDHPYYLGPDTGAAKAYALLVHAMQQSGKVAIARFVLRNREHLAAIRAGDGVLTMATMRFADEVVDPEALGDALPDAELELSEREVSMAEALIEQLSTDFEPERYQDTYRAALLEMIERKAEGQEVVVQEPSAPEPAAAPDLMAALEQSLEAVRGSGGDGQRGGGTSNGDQANGSSSGSSSKSGKGGSKAKGARSKA